MSTAMFVGRGLARWVGRARRSVRAASGPALRRGERRIAVEKMPGGGELLATNQALHVSAHAGPECTWQRVPWTALRTVGQFRQPGRPPVLKLRVRTDTEEVVYTLHVLDRSRIADLVAELATSVTVLRRRVRMSDGSQVTFTATREAGSGTITWSIEDAPGTERSDPVFVAELNATLRELRAQAGC